MTTAVFIRNCEVETTCAKCGKVLTAPKWSEYVSDGLVLEFWHCLKCGYQFETEAYVSADAATQATQSLSTISGLHHLFRG